jgi:hypothetical protein
MVVIFEPAMDELPPWLPLAGDEDDPAPPAPTVIV